MRTALITNGEGAASSLEGLTLRGALRRGARRLAEAGVDSAALDTEVLLRHALQLEQTGLYLALQERLSPTDQKTFEQLLERRAAREPLSYITGNKEFWSLDFIVTPAVLIPRRETELLVEMVLEGGLTRGQRLNILDIGTGSGAIAVSLAKHLPKCEIWAIDMSSAAVRIAGANAKTHQVEERVHFLLGDLFEALGADRVSFDLILSNPPYVRTADLAGLEPEIRHWEPLTALDGGADGLDYYRRIIGAAPSYLNEGGRILFEIGADLSAAVVGLFERASCFAPASIHRDYAGRDRVVMALKGVRRG